MSFRPDMTLAEAKAQLRAMVRKGARCPCCNQLAKVYRRKLNSGMARSLINVHRLAGIEWVHLPDIVDLRSREEGKLAYWNLMEEATEARPDGGRAGWWRITGLGDAFVRGQITVPKYALVYDGRLLKLEGDKVSIKDCLGDKFNYQELMQA